MAGANSPSYPVSVAGRAARESQTRVRPWLVMAGRRPEEGVIVSRTSSHKVVLPLLMFQDVLPACRRSSHRLSRISIPLQIRPTREFLHLLCPRKGLGTPGYKTAVTVSNLSDSLPLPPVIVYHINSITSHAPPHTQPIANWVNPMP